MLHLSGRCHCVLYGRHRWRDPRVPCSHGRGMAPHSPHPLALYAPLSPAHLSALDSRSRFRIGPPLSSFFLLARCLHAFLPSEPHPLLFPHSSSHRERTMAMLFPTSCPTSDPPPRCLHSSALRHHPYPPSYKCPFACLSSIPPSDPK
jgi:hypothetical protein